MKLLRTLRRGLRRDRPHPFLVSPTYGRPSLPKTNLIREVRKYQNKGKQSSKTSSLAIEQREGPLVPPQGYRSLSIPLSCFADPKTSTKYKKLTVC